LTVPTKKPLFPSAEDAPLMLQKKIWIQINKLISAISVSTGDMVGIVGETLLYH
jgi:hypothetical protein